MNDDELSTFLMGEIPEPEGDFWSELHDRLESTPTNEAAGGNEADRHDASIIDLAGARQRRNPNRTGRAAWRSAAAAVVLIAGGAVAFNSLDENQTQTAASQIDSSDAETNEDNRNNGANPADGRNDDGDAEVVELADIEPAWWTPAGPNPVEIRVNPTDAVAVDSLAPNSVAVLSTGSRVKIDDVEWIQVEGVDAVGGGQGWILAERLDRLGEFADPIPTGTYAPIGPYVVLAGPLPGGTQNLTELRPIDRITTTGRRAVIDNSEWLEAMRAGAGPIWVLATEVVAVERNQPGRQCLVNGDDLIFVDFTDATSFVGARLLGGSYAALSGTRLGDPSSSQVRLGVNIKTVVIETGDDALPRTEEWQADTNTLTTADGVIYTTIDCAQVADTVQQIEQIIESPPDQADVIRSCFADGDNVFVLDHRADKGIFTGAFTVLNSIEAFSAAITSEQRGGTLAVLDVNTIPIGSSEDPTREEWTIINDPRALVTGNRVLAETISCDDVSEAVAELDQIVGVYPEPPPAR